MTDKTDSKVREIVSAMVDNEASEFELFRTTKMLSEDDELRQTWHRYHLARSVIGTEGPVIAPDLSAQIASAIELEAELLVSSLEDKRVSESEYRKASSSSNRTFSKIAIAASVAMVAVFGVQYLQLGPENIVNTPSNQLASKATNEVNAELKKPDGVGPQFQLPSGYSLPHVNVRTVSTAPVHSINQALAGQRSGQAAGLLDTASLDTSNMAQEPVDSETHRQVESYLNRMMLRHAQQ
ncbi:MAG: sigma-E factor negative regulatory protein [Porticoccaceae bacterium]|nr:sigma-E factor negative regulatory protein [Porticoccaceae bacterium]